MIAMAISRLIHIQFRRACRNIPQGCIDRVTEVGNDSGNSRNGASKKKLKGDLGEIELKNSIVRALRMKWVIAPWRNRSTSATAASCAGSSTDQLGIKLEAKEFAVEMFRR